jgi:hypothetical protein
VLTGDFDIDDPKHSHCEFTKLVTTESRAKRFDRLSRVNQSSAIENWIVDTLLLKETILDYVKDNRKVLEKMGIDKESMRAKGISKENLDRIFRAMVVYSKGTHLNNGRVS